MPTEPSLFVVAPDEKYDDDGQIKRTGTWQTASAHIITTVIGSGVLSLSWCFAQLGWIPGVVMLLLFSIVSMFTAILLSDCYRSPDRVYGTRNYTYMHAVKANLGMFQYKLCGFAQYGVLIGITIGYTTTTAISMAAIQKSNCYHKHGHHADCRVRNNPFMVIFAIIQIILSQVPNFHKLSPLSIIAAIMSFMYSTIGIGLSISKIVGEGVGKTSLVRRPFGNGVNGSDSMWKIFSALGDIAFAFSFTFVLIEIQDTLKSSPPENETMKKATTVGISASTVFYMLCGALGYAAFGHDAPGNFLTGFGFFDPFWLVDLANICIVVHLLGAYQVLAQPFFGFIDDRSRTRWPQSTLITKNYSLGGLEINLFRLIWRTSYVILVTIIAMIFPFFNDFVGLLGACTFWPLTVYFPIEMYISQAKIRKFSSTWFAMQLISVACLIVSLVAAAGSTRGLVTSVQIFEPFQSVS
ncbi:amino acid permease 6-like [Cynara cardunculus var. scolymus]|uniref:amino acid permease 6-like n=1 Tax=Cynara cardunculus var. scolymus TaxID=59895 RepID=UPI000D6248B5|nr:amino acid permease 6-like [Cynara cardunculus var. scolymus]